MADIAAGAYSSSPTNLVNLKGTLFIAATDGLSGAVGRGTTAGTVLVKDINVGGNSPPANFATFQRGRPGRR